MRMVIGIFIGVSMAVFVALAMGDFGKENSISFSLPAVCRSLNSRTGLKSVHYEPENGTLIGQCEGGAIIEIIAIVLKVPEEMEERNRGVRAPAQIFFEIDINEGDGGQREFILKTPPGWVDYGGRSREKQKWKASVSR